MFGCQFFGKWNKTFQWKGYFLNSSLLSKFRHPSKKLACFGKKKPRHHFHSHDRGLIKVEPKFVTDAPFAKSEFWSLFDFFSQISQSISNFWLEFGIWKIFNLENIDNNSLAKPPQLDAKTLIFRQTGESAWYNRTQSVEMHWFKNFEKFYGWFHK